MNLKTLEAINLEKHPSSGQFSPLTEAAFGLSAADLSSIDLPHNIELRVIGATEAFDFYTMHAAEIYQLGAVASPFLAFEPVERKARFYALCGDFYGFFSADRLVGIFAGNTVDWSSYYFRNCSILPRYQGLGIYSAFLSGLITVLRKVGVSRITGDVAASNFGHVHVLNRLGFRITGVNLTERWGAMTQFTLLLDGTSRRIFDQQFCHGKFGKEEST